MDDLYEAAVDVRKYFAIRSSSDPEYRRVMRNLQLAIQKRCKHEHLKPTTVWLREGQLFCHECGMFFKGEKNGRKNENTARRDTR